MKKTLAFLLLFFVATLLFTVQAQSTKAIRKKVLTTADSGRRSALVIGNAAYASKPLRNSVNDARAMSRTLRELGFSVELLEDASQKEMKKAIDRFGEQLKDGGTGLFYFSGHGIQVSGRNYLIPVKYSITSEDDVEYESVDAGRVLAKMKTARNGMNIVILDACRNNPFPSSFRSASQGLATINAPSGTFISYATAPGSTASDGSGNIGLYTGELIRHMKSPGLQLEEVFKKVRADVQKKSSDKQVPWDASSLTGDFYFVLPQEKQELVAVATPAPTPKPAPSSAASEFRADEELWKEVKDSDSPEDFEDFLAAFPESKLAPVARIKLKRLKRKQAKVGLKLQLADEVKKLEEERTRLEAEKQRLAKAKRKAEEEQKQQEKLAALSQRQEAEAEPGHYDMGFIRSNFYHFFEYNGHSYATTRRKVPWHAVTDLARRTKGYPVIIDNYEENFAIAKHFSSAYGTRKRSLRIGISDSKVEGVWRWFDGSRPNYTNWAPGEPNDYRPGEDFAEIMINNKKAYDGRRIGDWNDTCCTSLTSDGAITIFEWESEAVAAVLDDQKKVSEKYSVVVDSSTGLMWQKKPDGKQRNWDDAKNYCRNLIHGGFSDWKLPNGKELRQLLGKYQIFDPYKLTGTWDSSFWSSQTASYLDAFLVNFGTGKTISYEKRSKHYVRCVRVGKAQESLTQKTSVFLWNGSFFGSTQEMAILKKQYLSCNGYDNCLFKVAKSISMSLFRLKQLAKDRGWVSSFLVDSNVFELILSFQRHTYALSHKNLGNAAGRRLAKKHGGYLITLNNSEEDRFIVKSYLSSRHKYLWVGFNDIGNEGKWSWFGPQSNYTNWLPSQPSHNNTEENCAAYLYPDKKWHDVPCYANNRAIVEWNKIAGNAIAWSEEEQKSQKITKKKNESTSKTTSRASIRQTYDKAVKQNSIFGFRNFIKEYKHESKAKYYLSLVKKKLKKLEGASETTTTSSSEGSSGYTKRQALLDFLEAKASNTEFALKNFLRKHSQTPDSGSYRLQARRLLQLAKKKLKKLQGVNESTTTSSSEASSVYTKRQAYLDFLEAKASNTKTALRNFLRKHAKTPDSESYRVRARKLIKNY